MQARRGLLVAGYHTATPVAVPHKSTTPESPTRVQRNITPQAAHLDACTSKPRSVIPDTRGGTVLRMTFAGRTDIPNCDGSKGAGLGLAVDRTARMQRGPPVEAHHRRHAGLFPQPSSF
jgi:hypothetical protein